MVATGSRSGGEIGEDWEKLQVMGCDPCGAIDDEHDETVADSSTSDAGCELCLERALPGENGTESYHGHMQFTPPVPALF
jgi:hypothetical protein